MLLAASPRRDWALQLARSVLRACDGVRCYANDATVSTTELAIWSGGGAAGSAPGIVTRMGRDAALRSGSVARHSGFKWVSQIRRRAIEPGPIVRMFAQDRRCLNALSFQDHTTIVASFLYLANAFHCGSYGKWRPRGFDLLVGLKQVQFVQRGWARPIRAFASRTPK